MDVRPITPQTPLKPAPTRKIHISTILLVVVIGCSANHFLGKKILASYLSMLSWAF